MTGLNNSRSVSCSKGKLVGSASASDEYALVIARQLKWLYVPLHPYYFEKVRQDKTRMHTIHCYQTKAKE